MCGLGRAGCPAPAGCSWGHVTVGSVNQARKLLPTRAVLLILGSGKSCPHLREPPRNLTPNLLEPRELLEPSPWVL